MMLMADTKEIIWVWLELWGFLRSVGRITGLRKAQYFIVNNKAVLNYLVEIIMQKWNQVGNMPRNPLFDVYKTEQNAKFTTIRNWDVDVSVVAQNIQRGRFYFQFPWLK